MIGRNRAFTLLELLVVIAIISILASILMPVMFKARKTSLKAVCQSNLKQISQAFESYKADYDGYYPNISDPFLWMGRRWRWPIAAYVCFSGTYNPSDPAGMNQVTGKNRNVLECPSDPTPGSQWDRTSYGYSAAFYNTPAQIDRMTTPQLYSAAAGSPPCVSVHESEVKWPANKAIVTDWLDSHGETNNGWWSWQGSRNYLFADGHVKFLASSAINAATSPYADISRTPFPDINLTTNGVAGKDVN